MEIKEKRRILAVIVFAYLGLLAVNLLGLTVYWEYIKSTYTAIAYLGIAILIWKNVGHLDQFHIDRLSLGLFVLSGSILRRRGGLVGELYFLPIIWLSSLLVFVVLLWRRRDVPKTKVEWVLWGFLLACLALIPISLVETANLKYWVLTNPFYKSIPITILRTVLYNLSFTAPLEEMLYRGFLSPAPVL